MTAINHQQGYIRNRIMNQRQDGFTLSELMLSLLLGLIISLAAFKLFSHSLDIQRIQLANLDVQESAIFNLTSIKKDIALANQGSSSLMSLESPWTGVVLTGSLNSSITNEDGVFTKTGNLRGIAGTNNKWVTQGQSGPSNIEELDKSDQLTVQYLANQEGYDCEGRAFKAGEMVIQRYFTRYDRQRADNESKALAIALACDAGRYDPLQMDISKVTKEENPIRNFGDNGVILINRIDFFEVKLGVRQHQGVTYMSIDDYLQHQEFKTTNDQLDNSIVAIQIGILVRGNHSIKNDDANPNNFLLNGQTRIIKQKYPSYLRRPVQSVIYLRHGENRL